MIGVSVRAVEQKKGLRVSKSMRGVCVMCVADDEGGGQRERGVSERALRVRLLERGGPRGSGRQRGERIDRIKTQEKQKQSK